MRSSSIPPSRYISTDVNIQQSEDENHLFDVKNISDAKEIKQDGTKSSETLISEIKLNNANNPKVLNLISKRLLQKQFVDINNIYLQKSQLCLITIPIANWKKEQFLEWAQSVKSNRQKLKDPKYILEAVSVIIRAYELFSGNKPRDIQILTLLLFLDANKYSRLAQVSTGEGKSSIIAILAAIKALQGQTVDIVTSSPVLAARDAEKHKEFFSLLALDVDHNGDKRNDVSHQDGLKNCYKAQIVYGSIEYFIWDILRHEYHLKNTRGQRTHQTLIVDECDNIMLDECHRPAKISQTCITNDKINLLFTNIWLRLAIIEIKLGDKNVLRDLQDEKSITKLLLEDYIINFIENKDLGVPSDLKNYIKNQYKNWVKSAIHAKYGMKLDRDYVKAKDQGNYIIAPVDYKNTGVVQKDCEWDEGLHKFLQIKHSLKIKGESSESCFMSYHGFFMRYKNQTYGLTGTLGGEPSKSFLKSIYDADCIVIPTFKESLFKKLPSAITFNETEHFQKITQSLKEIITKDRAVLIVCESIEQVDKLETILKSSLVGQYSSIERYSRNDTDELNIVTKILNPRQIIIATNLGGRGTDIQVSKSVEKNGGLHVCLAFVPEHSRAKNQALGRTARSGKKGTGQEIFIWPSMWASVEKEFKALSKQYTSDFITEHYIALRDEELGKIEVNRLKYIKEVELKKIILFDSLFSKFCQLRSKLSELDNNRYKLLEVENRWSIWIKEQHKNIVNIPFDQILFDFNNFEIRMLREYATLELQDPGRIILNAMENYYDDNTIINELNKALALDNKNAPALYRRALTRIEHQSDNFKECALKDLKEAKYNLEDNLIPILYSTQANTNLNPNHASQSPQTPLVKGVNKKIEFYCNFISHIEELIYQLKNAPEDHKIILKESPQLDQIFTELKFSDEEINEIFQTGVPYFSRLEIKPPKPKRNLFGAILVLIEGILEIVAGVILTVVGALDPSGFVTRLGLAICLEGINDILYAVESMIKGYFNWKSYTTHKAVSLTVMLATLGLESIMPKLSNSQVAKQTNKVVGKKILTQSAKHLIEQNFVKITKDMVVKQMLKAGFHKVVSICASKLTYSAFKNFKNDIEKKIKENIDEIFSTYEVKQFLNYIFAIDLKNRDSTKYSDLKRSSQRIILNQCKPFINATASAIIKGIAEKESEVLNTVVKLIIMQDAIRKINELTDVFCDNLLNGLKHTYSAVPQQELASAKESPQLRDAFIKHIVDSMTSTIMKALHGDVITPLTDPLVKIADSFLQNIHTASHRLTEEKITHDFSLKSEDKGCLPMKFFQPHAVVKDNKLNNSGMKLGENQRSFDKYRLKPKFEKSKTIVLNGAGDKAASLRFINRDENNAFKLAIMKANKWQSELKFSERQQPNWTRDIIIGFRSPSLAGSSMTLLRGSIVNLTLTPSMRIGAAIHSSLLNYDLTSQGYSLRLPNNPLAFINPRTIKITARSIRGFGIGLNAYEIYQHTSNFPGSSLKKGALAIAAAGVAAYSSYALSVKYLTDLPPLKNYTLKCGQFFLKSVPFSGAVISIAELPITYFETRKKYSSWISTIASCVGTTAGVLTGVGGIMLVDASFVPEPLSPVLFLTGMGMISSSPDISKTVTSGTAYMLNELENIYDNNKSRIIDTTKQWMEALFLPKEAHSQESRPNLNDTNLRMSI